MSAKISLIAATGIHGELGAGNELMWHLPDDFNWFVAKTRGHAIVMGRKTMESLGRPLKNRRNIVISRHPELISEGFEYAKDLKQSLEMARETEKEEIFIIGGGEIYTQSMHIADRIFLTKVNGEFPDADTFFPAVGSEWKLISSEKHDIDEKHAYDFEFTVLEK